MVFESTLCVEGGGDPYCREAFSSLPVVGVAQQPRKVADLDAVFDQVFHAEVKVMVAHAGRIYPHHVQELDLRGWGFREQRGRVPLGIHTM